MTNQYAITGVLAIIGNSLLCIAYIVGIIAGILAITRKQTRTGILAVVAFILLGLEILLQILLPLVVLPAIIKNGGQYAAFNWISFCTQTPLALIGAVALVILVFTNAGRKTAKSLPEEPPPAA